MCDGSDSGLSNCNTGVNSDDNRPEEITVQVQDDDGLIDTSGELKVRLKESGLPECKFREYGSFG